MINLLFVMDALKEGFIGIILTLDTLIYGLIASAFRVFMAIASARLLSSEAYYAIANKVYLVIGVLMLFVLSYGILKAIVNPDEGTKQMGPGLLKKIAIAVVGLAVTPALFNLMYQAQGLVLEHDVLAKLFFRSENTDKIQTGGSLTLGETTIPVENEINPDDYVKTVGGSYTATTIWQAFFYPAPDSGLTAADITADPSDYYLKAAGWGLACGGVIGGTIAGVAYFAAANIYNPIGWILGIGAVAAVAFCGLAASNYDAAETGTAITDDEISLEQAYALTAAGESFGLYTIFLDNYLDDGEISYLFGISTLCGAFALYAFASFSIDMGIRAAKLAYFQVIAPIPLVMQILPGKDGVFKDYTKKVIHTFLEVFIRISVVYIVIYLICHLSDLFSSADALWGNTDLTKPELMFAMAFLIIGLIIFCKEAPKFFGETLGINSGNMSLGLRKKLADGGVYNALGVGYGGLTTGVRNFRKRLEDGKGVGHALRSGIAGAFSGSARAAKSLIGPGHEQAKSLKDVKNMGEKAAQAATDKRDERDVRLKEIQAAQTEAREAQAAIEQAIRAGDTVAEQKARERLAEAQNRFMHATAIVSALDTAQRKLDSWSLGSVSVEQEQAAIKFGKALDSLKGQLREEAYKKDHSKGGAAQLKDQYDTLKAQPISEYEEGWDEVSANEEYRNRRRRYESLLDPTTGNASVQAAQTDLEAKRNALDALEASGLRPGDARYDQAALELSQAVTNMNAQLRSVGFDQDLVTADGNMDFFAGVKVDMAKASAERDAQLEGLRIAMEAAADAWVQGKALDPNSNTARDIQAFLTDHAAYIADNRNSQITVGYQLDANGNPDYTKPITESLGAAISTAFGSAALNGKFVPDDVFRGQASFVWDLKTSVNVSGTDYSKITYKQTEVNGSTVYVPYVVDSNGQETAVHSTDYPTYSEQEFFTAIKENVVRGKIKKTDSKTAVAIGADKGKTSSVYVAREELAPKNQKIRQSQDSSKK